MIKQIELKKGYILIYLPKLRIKWINKKKLSYVIKCVEAGRFDLIGMTADEVEKVIKYEEEK